MNVTCNISQASEIHSNSSLELNGSLPLNSSCLESKKPGMRMAPDFTDFYTAAFGSSIFIIVVSFATILANGFLLLAFYVDPLKIFRNPTTSFLIGLAIVDLLTALVQEPIYATCFMFLYLQNPVLILKCGPVMDVTRYIAGFTMTVSYLIVFAFTVTQYIVVSSPLKYARLVTNRKVLISVAAIYLYSTAFWCLHLIGVPENILLMIELFLHDYASTSITIAIYILLHRVMKKKMVAGNSLQGKANARGEDSKHTQVQRNFVRVNFMLIAVLITCSIPSSIVLTIRSFTEESKGPSVKVAIGNLMVDNLLYLKFLLDPFVYAWRMVKYREAFFKSIRRQKAGKNANEKRNNVTGRENQAVTEISSITTSIKNTPSTTSTVTLLSFKELHQN